jgi:hypothetical protein
MCCISAIFRQKKRKKREKDRRAGMEVGECKQRSKRGRRQNTEKKKRI